MSCPAVVVAGGAVVASNDSALALTNEVLSPAGSSFDELLGLIPVDALAVAASGEWHGYAELGGENYRLRLRRAYGVHVLRVDLDAPAQETREQRQAEYAALGRAVSGLVGELGGVAGVVDGAVGVVSQYLQSMQGAVEAVSRVADRAGGWATAELAAARAELCVDDLRRAALAKLTDLDKALGVISALTRAVASESIARRAGSGAQVAEARGLLEAAAGLAVMGAGNVRVDLLAGRAIYVSCDRAAMVNALATTIAACFPVVGATRLVLSAGTENGVAVLTVRGKHLGQVVGVGGGKRGCAGVKPSGASWAARPGISSRLAEASIAVATAGGAAHVSQLECGGALIKLILPLAMPAAIPEAA